MYGSLIGQGIVVGGQLLSMYLNRGRPVVPMFLPMGPFSDDGGSRSSASLMLGFGGPNNALECNW